MRLAATLVSIFALCFLPVFAQSERRVAECDGLERWYTGIPVDEYKSAYDAAMDASSARALREYATETLPGFVEAQLRAISADDELCLTMARSYLIYGWSKVNDAVTQIQEGNTVLGLASLSIAMQRIGELRGFVVAHGIDIVCAECGYAANVRSATNRPPHVYRYLACSTVTRARDNMPDERECSNRTFLREDALQEYVNILLKRMIEAQSLALVTRSLDDVDTSALLAAANKRVDELNAKLLIAVKNMTDANVAVRHIHEEVYKQLTIEYEDALAEVHKYVTHQRPPDTRQQEAALSLITRLTLDAFWQQEPAVIRQTLRELLGGLRFAIEGGRVVGLTRFRR